MLKSLHYSFFVLLLLVLIGSASGSFAQYTISKSENFYGSKIPQFIEFDKSGTVPEIKELKEFFIKQYNFDLEYELLSETKDELGILHSRYKQLVKGKEIEIGRFNVHSSNGKIISINGFLADRVPAEPSQTINETAALSSALEFVGASKYMWENTGQEKWLKEFKGDADATYYPKGKLVWYSSVDADAKRAISKQMKLAYKFDIYAEKPVYRAYVYVDATTGKVLGENKVIHDADVVATGNTGFSGNQTFTCDYTGSVYRLRETGRGNGVETYDMQNDVDYSLATDFYNTNATWNTGTPTSYLYALDAHWGAEMTYDYYMNIHGRNSIDGNGFALLSYIHYDVDYANAFWDGMRMTYGDGSSGSTPYTTLDIVGHEITHGLTSNTADLIYNGESGALNESFSDIFGVSIEWFAKPNVANWLMGDERGSIIRNLGDPNSVSDPDTYQGNYWISTTSGSDNGGVHTNSNVQNYWYYLLVNGGNGVNDLGNSYSFSGVGMVKAEQIAFRTLVHYLVNSSDFNESRFYTIQSAVDLYGACSPEVEAVVNAWYAVGLGSPYQPVVNADFVTLDDSVSCQAPFTVGFNNLSVNGTNFVWNFGDGTTSTLVSPTHTYTTNGTYTVTLTASSSCGTNQTIKTDFILVSDTLPCTNFVPSTTIERTECVGELFDDGGSASNYTDNQTSYALLSPNSGNSFMFNLDFYDIESGFDYLLIYDGVDNTGMLLDSVSGQNSSPNSYISNSGSVYFVFYSDNSVTHEGFKISWDCNDSRFQMAETCTGSKFDSGGENGNYDNNETFITVIEPPFASQIFLSFPTFDVEEEVNCDYDYIEVYDGNSLTAPLIGRYCNGTPPPNMIISTGGALTIKFYSDISVNLQGYEYMWNCNSSVGIEEEKENQTLSVYPNPTNSNITISGRGTATYLVILLDITGREVKRISSYKLNTPIDITGISKGNYILNTFNDSEIKMTEKIIIQ